MPRVARFSHSARGARRPRVLLPLAAFVVAERRVERVRRLLAAGAEGAASTSPRARRPRRRRPRCSALAAAQPALSNTRRSACAPTRRRCSSSTPPSRWRRRPAPKARTRLERATAAARRLRAAVPYVPSGVATLTDRVLPNLLPVRDAAAFDATLRQSVGDRPAAAARADVRATTFGALAGVPGSGYFDRSAKREPSSCSPTASRPPSTRTPSAARSLEARRTKLLADPASGARDESIYEPSGRRDPNYRPDPRAQGAARVARRARPHGTAFDGSASSAAPRRRSARRSGPARRRRTAARRRRIRSRPYVALLALAAAGAVFGQAADARRAWREADSRSRAPCRRVPFMPAAAWPATVHR